MREKGSTMKAAIVYYSQHHGNTKKLLDGIKDKHDVDLINVTEEYDADLSEYEVIGLASGIYYGSFAKQIIAFAEEKLPAGKAVFLISTSGAAPSDRFYKAVTDAVEKKSCKVIGRCGCFGYDTFGPFKLVGGIRKGHPTGKEIAEAVAFFEEIDIRGI